MVTFLDETDDGSEWSPELQARRFDASGIPVSSAFRVQGHADRVEFNFCDLGIAGDGRFVVVWAASDWPASADRALFGQRFDAEGKALGTLPFP